MLKIALVVPHIFMHKDILPNVIFSPGHLALDLARGLQDLGCEVTLFSPGSVDTKVKNISADLSLFENELNLRGDTYMELLKKHPLVFITLARQVQSEMISKAYKMANEGEFDLVHVYTNEEEMALVFAEFCKVPVVFTHHEPFNFLTKYRSIMPKYNHLNWISISDSQRKSMPIDTNFVATIYHGLAKNRFKPIVNPKNNYIAFFGRIIEPKGVHIAIEAAKKAGVKLKIAGKHYTGHSKDKYWSEIIEPQIDGDLIEYVGFIKDDKDKEKFLGNAKALIMASTWEEPFGMVMIEALACGTPVIGLKCGAIPEVVENNTTGYVVRHQISGVRNQKVETSPDTIGDLVKAINKVGKIDRKVCRAEFEKRFSLERMCEDYFDTYKKLIIHN